MQPHLSSCNRPLFRFRRVRLFIGGFLLAACLFLGAGNGASSEIVDRILAVVNDDIITLYEFNQALKPYETRIRSMGYPPEKERQVLLKIRGDILNQLIDQKLADQEIRRLNLSAGDKEIEAAIERIQKSEGMTEAGLRSALKEEGLTLEAYRKRIKDQILRSKLVNRQVKSKIVITPAEIRAYYEGHPERYGPQKRYRLRHILMRLGKDADEKTRDEKRKQMASVLKELKAGNPFGETAAKYSEVLAEEGGLLGLFDFDELSEELQEALKGKGAGAFTGILETDPGLQIVYIEEILDLPAKALEKVSAEIEELLFQERIQKRYEAWLEEMKSKSIVKRID